MPAPVLDAELLLDEELLLDVELLLAMPPVPAIELLLAIPPMPPMPVLVLVGMAPPPAPVPWQSGWVLVMGGGGQQNPLVLQVSPAWQSSLLLSVLQSCPSLWALQPGASSMASNDDAATTRSRMRLRFTRGGLAESAARAYGGRRRR